MVQKFQCKLIARGPGGAWTHMDVPFSVHQVFGVKSRLPVTGTINDFPFRSSLMPRGGGTHYMAITKEMQAGAKAKSGDEVQVVMEIDTAERVVNVPPELKSAFRQDADASRAFSKLSYSCRKEFADWIGTAKRPETKISRVAKALDMIRAGKRVR